MFPQAGIGRAWVANPAQVEIECPALRRLGAGLAGARVITILLVDDLATTRRGLRMALDLESDLAIVGEAEDGAQALELIERLTPDIVVVDAEMPRLDGIEMLRVLRERGVDIGSIVLSIHDDPVTRARAKEAGAARFVGKHEGYSALVAAIRALGQR
jgi:DNA-binding NarL/FixJ family response regulator